MSLFYNVDMKTKYSIWLVIIALASMLWFPNLFTYGMFMDGVINASVAKLYAEGTGTFFNLQERYYTNGAYMGHPPLVFVIQGWFFKIFSSAFFMDKLYSFICALIQLLLIRTLWLQVVTTDELKKLSWLPCLLWLLAPIISWGYSSNLLENTMSLFTTGALITMARYIRKAQQIWLHAIFAALLTFAAVLCKGPVALFILVAPLLLVEVYADYTLKKAIEFSTIMILILGTLTFSLLQIPEAQYMAQAYLQEQLSPSISTEGASLLNRLQLIPNLLKALSVPLIVTCVVALLSRIVYFRSFENFGSINTVGIRFVALGLCGTLPIMLSNKQSAFYTIPAIPVFTIGFALLITPPVGVLYERFITSKARVAIAVLSVLCMAAMTALAYLNAGTAIRDKEMLEDLAQVNTMIGNETELCDYHGHFVSEYHLKAYINRLYGKVVTCRNFSDWELSKDEEIGYDVEGTYYHGKTLHIYYNPPPPPPGIETGKE